MACYSNIFFKEHFFISFVELVVRSYEASKVDFWGQVRNCKNQPKATLRQPCKESASHHREHDSEHNREYDRNHDLKPTPLFIDEGGAKHSPCMHQKYAKKNKNISNFFKFYKIILNQFKNIYLILKSKNYIIFEQFWSFWIILKIFKTFKIFKF